MLRFLPCLPISLFCLVFCLSSIAFSSRTAEFAGYRLLYQDYESDDFTGINKFRWAVIQHGFSMRL